MRRLVWAFLLAAGCDHHDHPHPHPSHEEEEESVQVTVWGDRFEIFLEHDKVVAGVPTAFVTHVHDLKTLEPRREGDVVFSLRRGDGPPIEHVEKAPKRPGIYIPELSFPEAGEWTVRLRILVDGTESVVELPPVAVHATKEAARKAAVPEAPEGISFLKEQQWKLRTRIEPVGRRTLVERLRLPAVVAVPPGGRASVIPPAAGRILGALPALGDRVERGRLLAVVQPPISDLAARLVEAEGEIARAKIVLAQAEATHARVEKLAAAGARSAKDLEEASSALQAARAASEAATALRTAYAKSGLSMEHGPLPVFELRAPIDGVVVRVGATVGEFVPQDRPVVVVLDASQVLVEARVPEADLPRVGASKEAYYEAPDGRRHPLPGEAVYFGPEVDAETRSVPLVWRTPNPDGLLRIGLALSVHLAVGRAEEALAVPESAIVDEEGLPVAFVQLGGESFEKRDLRLGLRDAGWVQVLDGLSAGDRVVTEGAYAVRLASLSTSIPAHGHAH